MKSFGSGWMRGSSPRRTLEVSGNEVSGNAGNQQADRPSKSAEMTSTLETRDLTIRFGGHVAVNRVSCTFRPGELTAIVGPNGAGKTTYFNLISGQLRPTEGRIQFDGADITKLSAPLRTRAGLGRAFQLTNLFPNLSVEENVRLAV